MSVSETIFYCNFAVVRSFGKKRSKRKVWVAFFYCKKRSGVREAAILPVRPVPYFTEFITIRVVLYNVGGRFARGFAEKTQKIRCRMRPTRTVCASFAAESDLFAFPSGGGKNIRRQCRRHSLVISAD